MTDWKPSSSLGMLRQRAACLALIRDFFRQRDVVEVQTPLLTPAGVTDPHIESLSIAGQAGFLRTSPEYFHKRLLAAGMGDLYELGPVFRGGERGHHHRLEFCLLEWYRLNWHWRDLAEEVCSLIGACAELFEQPKPAVTWLSWRDGFASLGLDGELEDSERLRRLAPELVGDIDHAALIDYLFTRDIQRKFEAGTVTVVHGYPASQAALAQLDPDQPGYAQRFEVFLGPIELANGYQELTCPEEQQQRFQVDNERRHALGLPVMPIDQGLLDALHNGLPECAGVALGVDRLLLALLGHRSLNDVCSF